MALGISRTYVVGVSSHQGLRLRLVRSSSFRVASCSIFPVSGTSHPRTYSTASSTLTKKLPVTAKATKKDACTVSSPSKRKAAVQVPQKKATSPEMQPVHEVSAKSNEKAEPVNDEAAQLEQLKRIEQALAFQHLMPTVDAWGHEVRDTLDVSLPNKLNITDIFLSPSLFYNDAKDNIVNYAKNVLALSSLISLGSIPGSTAVLSWRTWFKVFGTRSVKPNGLLAPVRQSVLEVYEELNKAVAHRNEKDIKKYSTFQYQTQALDLAKKIRGKTKNNKGRVIWQLHQLANPVQILSLRVTEGYYGSDEPKFGNRLLMHALVQFDTVQSLEIYNEKGVPLHAPGAESDNLSFPPEESWRVPAARKHVTEYLVLERRMWVSGTWQIREQIWPDVDES